jgi:DtxR family Mn-dependent transcriptional regulator
LYRTLIELKIGEKGKIFDIRGGRRLIQRLNDLGLTIGAIVTIQGEAPFAGPVRLLVRGSTLAIGRGIAARIIVQC